MVNHLLCTQGLTEMLRTNSLVGSTLILLEADKGGASSLAAAPCKCLGRSNHFLADSVNNKQQRFSAVSHQSHLYRTVRQQQHLSNLCCPHSYVCLAGETVGRRKEETRYHSEKCLPTALQFPRLLALALTGTTSDLKQMAQGVKIDQCFFTSIPILKVTSSIRLGIWYPEKLSRRTTLTLHLVKKTVSVMFLCLLISVYFFCLRSMVSGKPTNSMLNDSVSASEYCNLKWCYQLDQIENEYFVPNIVTENSEQM